MPSKEAPKVAKAVFEKLISHLEYPINLDKMLLTSTHHPVVKKVLGILTDDIVCHAHMTQSNKVV